MSNTKVYYLRHSKTGDYCTSGSWNQISSFSSTYAPHIFRGVGSAKSSVTNFIRSGWFETPEETAACDLYRQTNIGVAYGQRPPAPVTLNDKADRLQFAMDLEIVEIELVPGPVIHSFMSDLNKPKKNGRNG